MYVAEARSASVAMVLLLVRGKFAEDVLGASWLVGCDVGEGCELVLSLVGCDCGGEVRINLLEMKAWMLLATWRLGEGC